MHLLENKNVSQRYSWCGRFQNVYLLDVKIKFLSRCLPSLMFHTEISLDISSASLLYTDSLLFKCRSYIQATLWNTNIMRWIAKRAFFMQGIIICERRWENIRQTRWEEVRVRMQPGRWCKYENFPSTVSRNEEIWYPKVTNLCSSSSV